MNHRNFFLLGCFLWMMIGCTARTNPGSVSENIDPSPTVNNMFSPSVAKSTPEKVDNIDSSMTGDTVSESPGSRATLIPLPTLTPVPTIQTRIETIYDEDLNANWTSDNSWNVEYELQDSTYPYQGDFSLSFTPQVEYAKLAFTVNEDSDEIYLRDDVLAVSFWLYTGDDYVDTDDLAVAVTGSNEFSYWRPDDNSVMVPDSGSEPIFSETRLYFLNVEEDIPPDTWFQIELWLNDQIYDPEYKYVTGMYIKNDEDFFRTIYIDELEMLIRE